MSDRDPEESQNVLARLIAAGMRENIPGGHVTADTFDGWKVAIDLANAFVAVCGKSGIGHERAAYILEQLRETCTAEVVEDALARAFVMIRPDVERHCRALLEVAAGAVN